MINTTVQGTTAQPICACNGDNTRLIALHDAGLLAFFGSMPPLRQAQSAPCHGVLKSDEQPPQDLAQGKGATTEPSISAAFTTTRSVSRVIHMMPISAGI